MGQLFYMSVMTRVVINHGVLTIGAVLILMAIFGDAGYAVADPESEIS
jgi:ABC-type dipeptide/oligopeptide/nickel transport system permease component